LPAMLIVIGSAVIQYFQSKQLMPKSKDGRNLRAILKDAATGKNADSMEVNAATGRAMSYFIPAIVFLVTINIASALPLYWLTSGLIAYWQQAKILKKDEDEMDKIADSTGGKAKIRAKFAREAIIIEDKTTSKKSKDIKKSAAKPSNKKGN
jgi:membrane protein insertase Oxa1/YidC/SpoIIIJ